MPHNTHLAQKAHKPNRIPYRLLGAFAMGLGFLHVVLALAFILKRHALPFSWWPQHPHQIRESFPDLTISHGPSRAVLISPILILEKGQQRVVAEAESSRSPQATNTPQLARPVRQQARRVGDPPLVPAYSELVEKWRRSISLSSPHPPILPQPKKWHNGTTVLPVMSDFKFLLARTASGGTDVIDQAFLRYKASIFRHAGTAKLTGDGACILTSLEVSIEDIDFTMDLTTDESYELSIPVSQDDCPLSGLTARINAKTQVGALRALESFSQLVVFDMDREDHLIKSAPWHVEDAPRFPHREVLLDSSRHFLSVPSIKDTISSMAMAKLNVLHWHITDHESFPLTSRAYPLLSRAGAFSPSERYSPQDLKEVVEWGRLHGVRVIPELDVPGHASSWCAGYPDLCPSSECLTPLSPIHPTKLTPTASNITFEVVDALLGELAESFSGNLMHVGADEVDTKCWGQSSKVRSWIRANKLNINGALVNFMHFALAAVRARGKRPVVWEEAFVYMGGTLPKDVVVHSWLGWSTKKIKAAVASGHQVIVSNANYWYLNDKQISWEQAWHKDPCSDLTPKECESVIGGGGSVWGERADGSNLETRMWPRLAGIAEILWKGRGKRKEGLPQMYTDQSAEDKQTEDEEREAFRSRIHAFRCLLLSQGVAAEPSTTNAAINKHTGDLGPKGPGGCFDQ